MVSPPRLDTVSQVLNVDDVLDVYFALKQRAEDAAQNALSLSTLAEELGRSMPDKAPGPSPKASTGLSTERSASRSLPEAKTPLAAAAEPSPVNGVATDEGEANAEEAKAKAEIKAEAKAGTKAEAKFEAKSESKVENKADTEEQAEAQAEVAPSSVAGGGGAPSVAVEDADASVQTAALEGAPPASADSAAAAPPSSGAGSSAQGKHRLVLRAPWGASLQECLGPVEAAGCEFSHHDPDDGRGCDAAARLQAFTKLWLTGSSFSIIQKYLLLVKRV